MKMSKGGYDDMEWLDSLKKVKPQQEQEAKLANKTETEETVASALEDTSNIVFGLPDQRTKPEVIMDASKESMDKAAQTKLANEITKLKDKLNTHGVDPVALGVVSKSEWDSMADISKAEQLAKKAALAAEAKVKRSWEDRAAEEISNARAGKSAKRTMENDPTKDRAGRIAPTTARDDSAPFNQQVPKNAATIADPKQIDKFASEPTQHDKSVMSIREDKARKQIEAAKEKYNTNIPDDFTPMKASNVIHSGGKDADQLRYKPAANQVSMNDDVSGASPEEIKEKLSKLFEERIVDSGRQIREANEKRKAEISRPVQEKKDKEVVAKPPTSTQDMQKRLMELWMPEEPVKKE